MSFLRIKGGSALRGSVVPMGNKNEALPVLAACLLTREEVVLENIPRIRDVETMATLLEAVGARVSWQGRHEIIIKAGGTLDSHPPEDLCREIRASFLLAAPLLARNGKVELPSPGGDKIGRRRLDPHLQAFSALGANVTYDADTIKLSLSKSGIKGAKLGLDEPSVMATENALMLAATTPEESIIYPAACEPHVQGLCRMLVSMGASIKGIGTNELIISGPTELAGAKHKVSPDHIEVGSFVGLAASTGSLIEIGPVEPRDLGPILRPFRRLGVKLELDGGTLRCFGDRGAIVETDLDGAVPRLSDGPWPAVPPDIMSILVVTATQMKGTVLLFEKMFESRLFWVDRLIAMGANAILCDPHRVVIVGPAKLRGTKVASPDIRAGMALLIAALVAEGTSEIHNVEQIDRGYEAIEKRLSVLGATIERGD